MSRVHGDDDAVQKSDVDSHAEPLVTVDGLKTYYHDSRLLGDPPVRAVDDVSFDIREGETFGIVGESGCGKTTLGRSLIGLETADSGEIVVNGRDITGLSGGEKREWQRDAQMVFQDPEESLNDRMTIGEIVREPLDAHDWGTPDERRERVAYFLDRVGLQPEHYYRYPHQFSGGQRQRIGIARALVLEPEFVVLDEPVSALDVSVQARIINLLEELQDELGLTYLFIAHDLSVVRHICDRVGVMYLGNIVERGPTEAIFTDPQHPYTDALLSAIPGDRTAGAASNRERVTLRGTPPSPRYPPDGCPFTNRCPAKVHPDEFSDLDHETWVAIEEFRDVLRARDRADTNLLTRLQGSLGVDVAGEEVDEIVAELFGDRSLPEEVRTVIDEAADRARTGADGEAADHLGDAFGSVCDEEYPEAHEIEADRVSRCVRHREEYRDIDTVLAERHRGD
ncbi:ABC transporter ATP-binding protein [Halorussus salinisoli]|uniref:ABC transporter ATP-binding protein n=1 Tax=Halorussus salinisoli TaxID=2558242 RepID=UPI0010C1626F|nr:oligopeptide/dipeptide ABC transporter ATP-binding protein [Halorussus salinisoli]